MTFQPTELLHVLPLNQIAPSPGIIRDSTLITVKGINVHQFFTNQLGSYHGLRVQSSCIESQCFVGGGKRLKYVLDDRRRSVGLSCYLND